MRLFAICAIALTFGFFGSMPLAGPIAVMTLSRAARQKYGEALRVGLGAAVAEGIYAGVAFWGFATFLSQSRVIVPISRGATAVILTALGVRFMFWRPATRTDQRESKTGTLLLGFSVSALNPTLLLTWMTAVAFLYSKGLEPRSPLASLPFGLCAATGVAGWFVCLSLLLEKYRDAFPRAAMTHVVRAMGLALVVLGIWASVELAKWVHSGREGAESPRGSLLWDSCAPYPSPRDAPSCLSWSTGITTSA